MAGAYVQRWRAANSGGASSLTVSVGANASANNLLFAIVCVGTGGDSFTDPSGWTRISTYSSGGWGYCSWYKIANGTSDSVTFTWTDHGYCIANVAEFSGLDSIDPFLNEVRQWNGGNSTSTTLTGTPDEAPGTCIAYGNSQQDFRWPRSTTTIDDGFTKHIGDYAGFSSARPSQFIASKNYTDTSQLDPTWTNSGSGGWDSYWGLAFFKEPDSGSDIVGEVGSFTLTGGDGTLTYNLPPLAADAGVFALTGGDAGLTEILPAAVGDFTLTGGDAALRLNYRLSGDVGDFTLTGGDSTLLLREGDLNGNAGVFTLTGGDASLGLSGFTLVGDTGEVDLTGGDANFIYHPAPIVGDVGDYTLTGGDATFTMKVLAENVPSSGTHGPAFMYPELSFPADNGKEVEYEIVTPPAAGTFTPNIASSFTFSAPDGTYYFEFTMTVDGVPRGGVHRRYIRIGI